MFFQNEKWVKYEGKIVCEKKQFMSHIKWIITTTDSTQYFSQKKIYQIE